MKTPAFEVHMPKTLDDALETAKHLHDGGHDFDWISGGTDLIPNYKWGINSKPHVISISGVSELKGHICNKDWCYGKASGHCRVNCRSSSDR